MVGLVDSSEVRSQIIESIETTSQVDCGNDIDVRINEIAKTNFDQLSNENKSDKLEKRKISNIKVTLLGTGGPRPVKSRASSSILVSVGSDQPTHLLFDAGRGAGWQLAKAHLQSVDLDLIAFTHLHFDHIQATPDLLITRWYYSNGKKLPPPIVGPVGTHQFIEDILRAYKLDEQTRIAEENYNGEPIQSDLRKAALDKTLLLDFKKEGDHFFSKTIQGKSGHPEVEIDIKAYPIDHMTFEGINKSEWQCFGYKIIVTDLKTEEVKTIAISGDAVHSEKLDHLAKGADLLILNTIISSKELKKIGSDTIPNHVMTCSPQAGEVAKKAGVKKLVLTHISTQSIDTLLEDVSKNYPAENTIIGADLMEISL